MKLSALKTVTIVATVPNGQGGLDGNIEDFVKTLKEEQLIEIRFAAAPGFFAAFIVYTL